MRRSMPRTPSGPIRRKASTWSCCTSPDPARTAAALRSGEIDVMWGGPLRVMLTHAQDPAADSVCFCDVIARDPFFVIGREPRPDFRVADLATCALRLGGGGADAVALPAGRPAPRRRRSGVAEPHQRPEHGGQCRRAAGRCAGCRAALPTLRGGTDRIGCRSCLVCGGGSRPHRLHHAGDASAAAASRAATNCCA